MFNSYICVYTLTSEIYSTDAHRSSTRLEDWDLAECERTFECMTIKGLASKIGT